MLTAYNALVRYDPTRTLTLRNTFARAMSRRFDKVGATIRYAVVNEDVFGLSPVTFARRGQTPGAKAFQYPSMKDRVTAFMDWVNELVDKEILETQTGARLSRAVEIVWTNYYVRLAYEKGIERARREIMGVRSGIPSIENSGGVRTVLNHPLHLDKINLLYEVTYRELKGVTDAMQQQINRVLAQAMTEGKNANQIVKRLLRVIGGPSLELTDTLGRFIPAKRRAQMIARTELIRAFHRANIQEMRNWGIANIKVKAEWTTMKDAKVCPDCASMDGAIFSLDEIEGLIPLHPQCRCVALPHVEPRRGA